MAIAAAACIEDNPRCMQISSWAIIVERLSRAFGAKSGPRSLRRRVADAQSKGGDDGNQLAHGHPLKQDLAEVVRVDKFYSLRRCGIARKAMHLGGHVSVRWTRDIGVVFDFLEPRLDFSSQSIAKYVFKIIIWLDRLGEEAQFGPVQQSSEKFGLTPVASTSQFPRRPCPS
jgi:hypothetical protein